jgi:ATP-dependent DNA ligase
MDLIEFQLCRPAEFFPRGLVEDAENDKVTFYGRECVLPRIDHLWEQIKPRFEGPCFLDGEFVYGEGSRSAYSVLAKDPVPPLGTYHIFDCVHLDGGHSKTLRSRRYSLLDDMVTLHGKESIRIGYWHELGNPRVVFEEFLATGHEGMVMKRLDKPYKPGRRSKDWLKFKPNGT